MSLEQRINVRVVTKDGADVYDWVARQSFPNATQILDKFHILKWAFNALQYMRIQLKRTTLYNKEKRKKLQIQYSIDSKLPKKNKTKTRLK
jgi:transposase